jgi:CRP-like cAMP-binding protein
MLRAVDDEAAASLRALAPRVELLESSPVFAGANRLVLERLAAASEELEFPPGTEVLCQGEPADALYLLVTGSAQASTAGGKRGGERRVLGQLDPGTVFGEIGLLDRVPRTATVTALESCRVLRINGDAFLEALTSDPLAALVTEIARTRQAQATVPDRDPEPVG